MNTTNKNGWKTCSRGHKYRGSDGCPTCWKGSRAASRAGGKQARSTTRSARKGTPQQANVDE